MTNLSNSHDLEGLRSDRAFGRVLRMGEGLIHRARLDADDETALLELFHASVRIGAEDRGFSGDCQPPILLLEGRKEPDHKRAVELSCKSSRCPRHGAHLALTYTLRALENLTPNVYVEDIRSSSWRALHKHLRRQEARYLRVPAAGDTEWVFNTEAVGALVAQPAVAIYEALTMMPDDERRPSTDSSWRLRGASQYRKVGSIGVSLDEARRIAEEEGLDPAELEGAGIPEIFRRLTFDTGAPMKRFAARARVKWRDNGDSHPASADGPP